MRRFRSRISSIRWRSKATCLLVGLLQSLSKSLIALLGPYRHFLKFSESSKRSLGGGRWNGSK